ncbi:MAG: hypothetical protein FP814_08395 [Desulfobacterium sp.]|nr:hypothetical protein [Desulfobacterium sp.]MBU3949365.1 hypothetical protein [Pseudomonadota bacterium]
MEVKQLRNLKCLRLSLYLLLVLLFCSSIVQAQEMADYGNLFPLQVNQLAPDFIQKYQIFWTSLMLVGIIAYAVYRLLRHKDSILLFTMGAGVIAFFNEGNLEVLVHVTQPANTMLPVFWNYGMPMGLGLGIGYVAVFPLVSYIAYRYLKKGLSTRGFIILWAAIALSNLAMEVPGIALGEQYVYQPPQMLTILGFPVYNVWINATSWLFSGVLMYFFVPVLKGWKRPLISLLPFFAFAAGWGIMDVPIVCALNIAGMPAWGQWVLWFASLGLSIIILVTLHNMVTVTSKTRWKLPWATLDSEVAL